METLETITEIQSPVETPSLSHGLTLFMAASCGIAVATMYYSQPLLANMGTDLAKSSTAAAYIPMFTQVGTMFGMGLFVPLGDMFERRALICTVSIALGLMSVATALADSMFWLSLASVLLGLTCIVPHLILPFAAQLSKPEQRGKTLGTVVSGLLIGILCARTFSGFVGAIYGWRSVYWISAVIMFALAGVLRRVLPASYPAVGLKYSGLLASMWTLIRSLPDLRQSAFTGAMLFGAFSAFWATLIYRLSTPPFHYGSKVAGLFGVIGAAGAAAAPLVGRFADRRGSRKTVELSLWITLAAFLLCLIAGSTMTGLIAGVILMDLGVQAGHVSNQTRIYALAPEARSRLNTVYMVSYFLGGALGSALGAYAWRSAGWPALCCLGMAFMVAALIAHHKGGRFTALSAG